MRTFVYSLFFFHSPCLSISLRSHSTRLSFHVSFSLILQGRSLAKPAHAEICRASNKFTRYAYRVNRMKANANIAVISSLLLFLRDARAFSFDESIVRTSSQTSSSRAIRAIRKYTSTVLLARLKSICFCGLWIYKTHILARFCTNVKKKWPMIAYTITDCTIIDCR